MPRISFLAAALLLAANVALAADVKLVRVWPGYREADSFTRISEYFTGKENPGRNQILLRTKPNHREGLYFLTRVANHGAELAQARFELKVITARSPRETSYKFDATVPRGEHVFQIGLTGSDWPDAIEQPVAWHLALLDSDGHELAAEQSFLWSKPDKS